MENSQPGVIVTDRVLTSPNSEINSAVPLFIGYTERYSAYTLQAIKDFSEYEELFGGPFLPAQRSNVGILYYAVKHYFDNGGNGGFVLSLGSYDDAQCSSEEAVVAAFADPRIRVAIAGQLSITLVMIPDMVLLSDLNVLLWQQAWQIVLTLCQCRTGLFGLLETPDDPACAIECLATFIGSGREWGAAYWPRLVTDYYRGGIPVIVPSSAAMAATIEWVDGSLGVWTAPANRELSNVVKPTQSYLWVNHTLESGDASFNLIRSFPGRGTRIWGCRTLSTEENSPMRYVQTRRLLSYVEMTISQLVRIFLFEPNSEITWFKIKGQAINWLRKLWQQGGLYGTEENEAFSVALGLNETMTEADILAGQMIMHIRMSTLYPAEFIELTLQFDMSAGTAAQ
jgi:hypothetical protein